MNSSKTLNAACWLVGCFLILLPFSPLFAQEAPPATGEQEAFAITHGPYLQLLTENSVTIVWHTNRKGVAWVDYGTGENLDQKAMASQHGLIANDTTHHQICLENLQSGTTYRYRAGTREFVDYVQQHIVNFGEEITSPEYTFTTLDPAKPAYSFAVFSDIHERAADLGAMLNLVDWTNTDFVVYNGDMINDFMWLDQPFTGFVDISVERFATQIPFQFVRGNHEVRGRFARQLDTYFPLRDGRAYYAFTHGSAFFLVLDSGEDKVDSHEYYNGLTDFEAYRREQAEWVKTTMQSEAAQKARFLVVISHIPPRNARNFSSQDLREVMEPLLNAAGADLWLSGHTHRVAHLPPTPGANAYDLVIGATDTFTQVQVTPEQLQVRVIQHDGKVIEEFIREAK
ncbi:MAG: FN3 domain-containing metallophosphoesterase family protein [bacterium]|jgi:predicted phosphodiesterase|nr:FN3 domain-containing metallophosphoesterase family protein [bacterium]